MGSLTSKLVREGEIPAYLQRDADYCCGILAHVSFEEPGSFNQPKPNQLAQLSDDHWASLKLRIDPLARKFLDPHRSMFLAAILIFLLWSVFSVVRPSLRGLKDKYEGSFYNDDYYPEPYDENGETFQDWLESQGLHYQVQESNDSNSHDGNSDNQYEAWYEEQYQEYVNNLKSERRREYMYQLIEMKHDLVYWNLAFGIIVFALVIVTIHLSYGMLERNTYYDAQIQRVCLGEMRSRFQSEGFDIAYRTNQKPSVTSVGDCFWNMLWRPKRVIVFTNFINDSYDNCKSVEGWTSLEGEYQRTKPMRQSTALYTPPSFVLNSPINSPQSPLKTNNVGLADAKSTFTVSPLSSSPRAFV